MHYYRNTVQKIRSVKLNMYYCKYFVSIQIYSEANLNKYTFFLFGVNLVILCIILWVGSKLNLVNMYNANMENMYKINKRHNIILVSTI